MTDGILLLNLGSPDSPSVPDVRRYLRQFLMDERVIDLPWIRRAFVVYGFILPFRPRATAEAYQSIWTEKGSPLVWTTRHQAELLQKETGIPVEIGMRYGSPSVREGVARLRDAGVTRIKAMPLYPHYAMSSYETVVEETRKAMKESFPGRAVSFLEPFYDDPDYIESLYETLASYQESDYDKILFSYHGVPVRHLKKSDPTGEHCQTVPHCCERKSPAHETCYRAQCFRTTWALAKRAKIPNDKYQVAFQSRLGRDPWIEPFTDKVLERFPAEDVKKILVICPSFVTDCLETLEEIEMRGRETFMEAGGETFTYVRCLNTTPRWIQTLKKYTEEI